MEAQNILFILSDQHQRDALGCYGHPDVQTPHLDRLAAQGTRFANTYTPCAICVPARAALATGRYVHQNGHWDNAFPYDGRIPSWGHRLKGQGFRVDAIGKLHFRSAEDDNGFTDEIEPMNVVEGIGDLQSSIRWNPTLRDLRPGLEEAGPGDSTYLRYDGRNADNAIRWLETHARDKRPWVLFLSFVCPHPPYIAPPKFYYLYDPDALAMPPLWHPAKWPRHAILDYFRAFFNLDKPLDEGLLRRAMAAYYGVCSYLDWQIGRVLAALEKLGLNGRTRIIYASDHGDAMGIRGMTSKFTMYDESAAVPFIMAGADVPQGKVVQTPISLVDCFPTILEGVGAEAHPDDVDLPGESLWQIANSPDRSRDVLCEYHAVGSRRGIFMLRDLTHKYIYHVGDSPHLYDMVADPLEVHNLADEPANESLVAEYERRLRRRLDPEAVDGRAVADQRAKIDAFGGETAVRQRGTFSNSPTPDETPTFKASER